MTTVTQGLNFEIVTFDAHSPPFTIAVNGSQGASHDSPLFPPLPQCFRQRGQTNKRWSNGEH